MSLNNMLKFNYVDPHPLSWEINTNQYNASVEFILGLLKEQQNNNSMNNKQEITLEKDEVNKIYTLKVDGKTIGEIDVKDFSSKLGNGLTINENNELSLSEETIEKVNENKPVWEVYE